MITREVAQGAPVLNLDGVIDEVVVVDCALVAVVDNQAELATIGDGIVEEWAMMDRVIGRSRVITIIDRDAITGIGINSVSRYIARVCCISQRPSVLP